MTASALNFMLTRTECLRFYGRVDDSNADGCWPWIGRRNRDGYGLFDLDHRHQFAHRIAWLLYFGPVAQGEKVKHACRNPACVRPDHLLKGDERPPCSPWPVDVRERQACA